MPLAIAALAWTAYYGDDVWGTVRTDRQKRAQSPQRKTSTTRRDTDRYWDRLAFSYLVLRYAYNG